MFNNSKFDLSECLPTEIAVVDSAGAIVRSNRKWSLTAKAGLLGPHPEGWNYIAECEAAVQRDCNGVAEILAGLRAVLAGDSQFFVAVYVCPFGGRHHWFQVQISALKIARERYAVAMHVDVSGLQRDHLTGLPNRAMFDAQFSLALNLARVAGSVTGLIIADMNNLKPINDMLGHRVGDESLKALAAELEKMAGPDCMVARIGGDEFGVVLPANLNDLSAQRIRSRLADGVSCSIALEQKRLFISASTGIALYPGDGHTTGALFKVADQSMYVRKRNLART
jgi:diguanylate cyclase (GGDEF)-like protein